MKITLMCNAGLRIETDDSILLIDMPNSFGTGFVPLAETQWRKICDRNAPYHKTVAIYFTHDHPDHLDRKRLSEFGSDISYFIPDENTGRGKLQVGEFEIEYQRFDHAPIENAPPHVVTLIKAENKCIYVSADAALDVEMHKSFLNGRYVDAAFWTPMYMSKESTRRLMTATAQRNYIYHMPDREEGAGIWQKCEKNLSRYAEELETVVVLSVYPSEICL